MGATSTFATLALAAAAIFSPAARAETKFWHTYPQPPRVKPADPMTRLNLSAEIPEDADKYLWRITNKISGKAISTGGVRVFGFDGMDHGGRIGEIQNGTTVRLLGHRVINHSIFYEIPFEVGASKSQPGVRNVGWVEGNYIEAAGLNPNPGAPEPILMSEAPSPKGGAKPVKTASKAPAKATPAK